MQIYYTRRKLCVKEIPTARYNTCQAIIDEYHPKPVEDMQNALKEIFGFIFEVMLNGEMQNHLGYASNERGERDTENRCNGSPHSS